MVRGLSVSWKFNSGDTDSKLIDVHPIVSDGLQRSGLTGNPRSGTSVVPSPTPILKIRVKYCFPYRRLVFCVCFKKHLGFFQTGWLLGMLLITIDGRRNCFDRKMHVLNTLMHLLPKVCRKQSSFYFAFNNSNHFAFVDCAI